MIYIIQIATIGERQRQHRPEHRIDGLMAASLTYVLWVELFPLFRLAGRAEHAA